MPIKLPEWLEPSHVPDELCADAYERTPARYRAFIKTGIALAAFHCGMGKDRTDTAVRDVHLGFSSRIRTCPADLAILFFGENERAAARICAAAVLPILADVPQVIAVCEGRPTDALLVSLELCGVENICQLDHCQCAKLLEFMAAQRMEGRICLLHAGTLNAMAQLATELRLRTVNLAQSPRLLLLAGRGFDTGALEFCQACVPETDPAAKNCWDAVYTAAQTEISAPLKLGPGCEGFWLFPDLDSSFYKATEASFEMPEMQTISQA